MLPMILSIMLQWKKVFPQPRTAKRAIRQALSSVCVIGRRTVARCYLVQQDRSDWSSDYKLLSRCNWLAQDLFTPILQDAISMCEGKLLPLATDDTRLKKSGKKIASAHWGRDPLSPAFHVNLHYGLRFLHTAVLLPLHAKHSLSARALPVFFKEVSPVKKPSRKASDEEKRAYGKAIKEHNLSTEAVAMMKHLRQRVDELRGEAKILAFAFDGSYCNRTVLCADVERTIIIARARKDAKLCWPADEGRRIYSKQSFRPEEVLKDEKQPWQQASIFHGGKPRAIYYKEVNHLLWRRGGGAKQLRLLVVRPTPYRKTKKGRLLYRQPAYLLTTDKQTQATELIQIYFDRWQIEVAHKEMKESLGLGQAQVRAEASVSRQPALVVATYSAMHLAALKVYGARRGEEFGELPKYQRDKRRVSCQELIRKVRQEMVEKGELLPIGLKICEKSILAAATI